MYRTRVLRSLLEIMLVVAVAVFVLCTKFL